VQLWLLWVISHLQLGQQELLTIPLYVE